jgi:hypothetical protein
MYLNKLNVLMVKNRINNLIDATTHSFHHTALEPVGHRVGI